MGDDDRRRLIAKVFFVLTVRLEEAAAAAVDGQGRMRERDELRVLAHELISVGQEVGIIAEAAVALIEGEDWSHDPSKS